MDTGAQLDAPDTGADISGARTADNAGASNKNTNIEKGKAPKKLEAQAQAKPKQTALEQTTPAGPEKPAPQTPAPDKTACTPAKTPAPAFAKATPTPPPQTKPTSSQITKLIKEKSATPSASTSMTLHTDTLQTYL
jgi:hypothetical protein